MTARDLRALLKKREWLLNFQPAFPESRNASSVTSLIANALRATLIFTQEEAGTAVCISSSGLILTCSHCIAEDEADLSHSKINWLIFASGQVVRTECVAWDQKKDLALCRIVASQDSPASVTSSASFAATNFPFLPLGQAMPPKGASLICIGHPGAEDLESLVPGTRTNYDTLYISQGRYRGYATGQDIYDNAEIGALKHDCWTYWGHSGAPLIDLETGSMIGMHSSWDDVTGMRRGIGLQVIRTFIHDSLAKLNLDMLDVEGLREERHAEQHD